MKKENKTIKESLTMRVNHVYTKLFCLQKVSHQFPTETLCYQGSSFEEKKCQQLGNEIIRLLKNPKDQNEVGSSKTKTQRPVIR